MTKSSLLILCILGLSFTLYGQEDNVDTQDDQGEEVTVCTQNLRLARTLYEQGKLNEIPTTLNSCLKSGFTPEEKVEAYRLVAITYLYLDEPGKADEAMLNLLHTNPEYTVNENLDPAEYINLYRSFRTKWLFRWGVKIGGVYSIPHVTKTYNPTRPGTFSGNINIQFGGFVEFDELVPLIKLQPELLFTSKSYNYTSVPTESTDGSDGGSSLTAGRSLSYLELFITAKYNVWDDKNYYVSLSPGVGYLLSAELNTLELNNQESPTINLLEAGTGDIYNRINPQLFVGAGTEFKFGRLYAVVDVRYGYSFMNLINNRNAAPDLQIQYGLGESDYRLNTVTFTVSLMRAVYNPIKIIN